jgi:hypothetical protein
MKTTSGKVRVQFSSSYFKSARPPNKEVRVGGYPNKPKGFLAIGPRVKKDISPCTQKWTRRSAWESVPALISLAPPAPGRRALFASSESDASTSIRKLRRSHAGSERPSSANRSIKSFLEKGLLNTGMFSVSASVPVIPGIRVV